VDKIIIDIDNTISFTIDGDYENAIPNISLIEKMREYKEKNFYISLFTARNMRTYSGDISKIQKYTLPILKKWLERNNVPYDEIIIGKPWCGKNGFYVDDRAIRPQEFIENDYKSIIEKLSI